MSIVLMAVIGGAALFGGIGLGYIFDAGTTTVVVNETSTTLDTTVAANFGVSLWNGTTLVNATNSSYNCSALGSFSIKIAHDAYDAMDALLAANPTKHYNASQVAGNLSLDWYTFAQTEEMVSEYFFNPDDPTSNASFDGGNHVFDYWPCTLL